MKINKSAKSNKSLIAIAIVALLVMSGATVYAYQTKSLIFSDKTTSDTEEVNEPKENDVNFDQSTDEQKQSGADAKKDFIDKNYSEGVDPVETTSTIAITSLSGDKDKTSIRATVNSPSSNGICRVTASGPTGPVTATAELQNQGSYSICKGFDLSLSEGEWNITVTYEDGNNQVLAKDTRTHTVR